MTQHSNNRINREHKSNVMRLLAGVHYPWNGTDDSGELWRMLVSEMNSLRSSLVLEADGYRVLVKAEDLVAPSMIRLLQMIPPKEITINGKELTENITESEAISMVGEYVRQLKEVIQASRGEQQEINHKDMLSR